MGKNHLGSIDRYHEYDKAIQELMASILTGVAEARMLGDEKKLLESMCHITRFYPFVDLMFTLDVSGVQNSANIACGKKVQFHSESAKGRDRRQRPYYILAASSDKTIVTEPYLSSATGKLCITAVQKLIGSDGELKGYLALDIDLGETIEFLMGDISRKRFIPFFSTVYAIISIGLFLVVAVLVYLAIAEIAKFLNTSVPIESLHLKPFSVIIYLTLALAIFDLGKTILEEEVLMHKDIFRHSSTRRTITRFIAAILIAVSIESLLLMFKSVLTGGEKIYYAVLMMFAAVGLLIALGIYVYFGAKAEKIMLSLRDRN